MTLKIRHSDLQPCQRLVAYICWRCLGKVNDAYIFESICAESCRGILNSKHGYVTNGALDTVGAYTKSCISESHGQGKLLVASFTKRKQS